MVKIHDFEEDDEAPNLNKEEIPNDLPMAVPSSSALPPPTMPPQNLGYIKKIYAILKLTFSTTKESVGKYISDKALGLKDTVKEKVMAQTGSK